VVTGELVALAAFFVQANPKPPVLGKNILDFHGKRGADAGEGINHKTDQGTVAQSDMRARVDTVEQRAGLVSR
jgi:hypothetical protein